MQVKQRKIFYPVYSLAFALAFLFFLVQISRLVTAQSETINTANASILTSDGQGITFVLRTPLIKDQRNGIEISGLESVIQEPGAPALPYFSRLIGLPPGATLSVNVVEGDIRSERVTAVPTVLQADLSSANLEKSSEPPQDFQFTAAPPLMEQADTEIFSRDANYPQAAFELSDVMYYRDLRLVELRLFPVRYNPVQQLLHQAQTIQVSIVFTGADWDALRPLPAANDTYSRSIADAILNFDQATNWRSLPPEVANAPATQLPTDRDIYKIEINQDGLYELSYDDLNSAGMPVASVNPNTFEMMYRGESVAYQLANSNGDDTFDSGESVRFYGWEFDGPRLEEQFVVNNVLWLWADGTPTIITQTANITNAGLTPTANFLETKVGEVNRSYFATWTDDWNFFPNEPDAWYWDYFPKFGANPATRTYSFDLYDPVPSGPDADYTVEVFSRAQLSFPLTHSLKVLINSHPTPGAFFWYGRRSENIAGTVPITELVDGANSFDLVIETKANDQIYLNQITVDYLRQLKARNDQLIFKDEVGNRQFTVANFTDANWQSYVAWDITTPQSPYEITLAAPDLTGTGPYTLTVAADKPADSRFIVSTENVIQSASQGITVTQYTPPSLNPVAGGAEWLAISYADFIPGVNVLANHRSDPDFGGYSTFVADIEDVINQYGYGLPLPEAINNYLTYAMGNWNSAPSYLTLVGDATHNPRYLDCEVGCSTWSITATNYLLTNIVFEDRFQGAIPSDYTFTLLSGDDFLPDIAIGRIAAETITETITYVQKIIRYETNLQTPADYQQTILFANDNPDFGGDFCNESMATGSHIPDSYNKVYLCLPDVFPDTPTVTETGQLRSDMSSYINDPNGGASILNYRGHGSITGWASPEILNTDDINFWTNIQKPLVLLSADCLDGYFAWPGKSGLAETFLKLDNTGGNVGTVAHWSSTGLGFSFEHTVLHNGFYDGVFDLGLTAIGDAVNYSKSNYFLLGYDNSEMFAFTLQGDPAMQLFRPDLELTKDTPQSEIQPGDTVTFTLTIQNEGIYSAKPIITDTLPTGLAFQSITGTIAITTAVSGNDIRIDLLEELDWGETAVITITTAVIPGTGGTLTNTAVIFTPALDLDPSNHQDTASITVKQFVYLPVILKP